MTEFVAGIDAPVVARDDERQAKATAVLDMIEGKVSDMVETDIANLRARFRNVLWDYVEPGDDMRKRDEIFTKTLLHLAGQGDTPEELVARRRQQIEDVTAQAVEKFNGKDN